MSTHPHQSGAASAPGSVAAPVSASAASASAASASASSAEGTIAATSSLQSLPDSANASSAGIARNALFGYGATLIGALSGLIVTPLLLRYLGATQFGLWVLLLSVVGYLGLLEVGLYMTVSKRVAECLALDDRARLQQILGTAFVLYASLSAVVLVVVVILALNVGALFHLSGANRQTAQHCLLVLGVNQIFVFVFRLQPAILFGAGRMDMMTSVVTSATVFAAVVNIFLVMQGYDITALAFCTLATTILSGLFCRGLIARHLPQVAIRPRLANRETAREILKFGSRNATLSVAGTLAFGADALVIGLLLPVSNVAHYAIASKLTNLLKELCQKPIDVLLPAYSHSEAHGDVSRQFQLWSESVSLSMAICLPFTVAAWGFGDRIIAAWVGSGHGSSYLICQVLALMILLQLPGHASFMILTGTERNADLVKVYVVAAMVNLGLSVVLTRHFGPVGVALGSLLTVAVVDFLILPSYVCRQFGFHTRDYLSQSLAPLLPALGAAILSVLSLKYFAMPPGTIITLTMLGAVVTISWTAWVLCGIDAPRRDAYQRTARAALGKIVPGGR